MGSEKEALPGYSGTASTTGASTSTNVPSASDSLPSEAYPSVESSTQAIQQGVPTIDAPFNFPPAEEALPAYEAPQSPSAAVTLKLIAIPQAQPLASSPFLQAYPPCLLARGVTESTWTSFMKTISAFMEAKVSDRAISHAGDVAKQIGQGAKNFGKGVASHAKSLGKQIATHAKKGNVVAVAATAVSGIITIPIFTALGLTGTAVRLPGDAIAAISKSPRTPAERVVAYATVANEKWLHLRGLHAQLVDSKLLAHMLGVPVEQLLDIANSGKGSGASGQLKALEMHLEPMDVPHNAQLQLSDMSLWLVVAQELREQTVEE